MASGTMKFAGLIGGPINPEDLIRVPATPWVITSGMPGPGAVQGRLYCIDVRDCSCHEIFPDGADSKRDAALHGDATSERARAAFSPHGIDLVKSPNDQMTLLVVNHGGRESIEIFDVNMARGRLKLAWRAAVELPPGSGRANAVAHLQGGGFLVTSIMNPADGGWPAVIDGEATGKVWEWHPAQGWSMLPGSRMPGPNGLLTSADGNTVYVGGWRTRNIVRLSRGSDPVVVDSAATNTLTDNLRWSADGCILATGHDTSPSDLLEAVHSRADCRFPSRVLKVHPTSLAVQVLIRYDIDVYGMGTAAIEVGDEIWVGSARCAGVARFCPA